MAYVNRSSMAGNSLSQDIATASNDADIRLNRLYRETFPETKMTVTREQRNKRLYERYGHGFQMMGLPQ